MRVCFVASQFWPSVGGAQTQAEKQASYLQQLGQEVLVITLRHQKAWPSREEYSAVPIIRIGGLYRRNGTLRVGKLGHLLIDFRLLLTLWCLRRHYDLIHTLQISSLAFVAALVGRLTHKPVVVGVQNAGIYAEQENFPAYRRQGYRCTSARVPLKQEADILQGEIGGDLADLVQTAWGGHKMLNYLRTSDVYYQILSSRSYIYLIQHGFHPERIVYIPNGVDLRQFSPPLWQRSQQSEGRRVLLCVARLEYAKGVDVLLEAWARMLRMPAVWRENLQPRLCVVGDGTRRIELEQLVTRLEIQDHVEFLGTRHNIAQLMQEAWGFVLPSRWEGMPNALLEAMACGLPCVATRVSGSEDIIEQGSNGLLVEAEQPEQLAYALRLVVEDTALAQNLGWQGYETVLHYYQLDTTMQGYLTFYRYLLNRGSVTRRKPQSYVQPASPYPEEWQRYE